MLSHLRNDGGDDVLLLFDYRDLNVDEKSLSLIKRYNNIHLLAWSFGVWVGAWVCQQLCILPQTATAYNGTLYPVNERFGIPPAVAQGTLSGLNETTRTKFYQRMSGGRDAFQRLQQSHSQRREIVEISEELAALYRYFEQYGTPDNLYQSAVIGEQDRIFLPTAQAAAWQSMAVKPRHIAAPHFCFYTYSQWQQLSETDSS